MGLQFFDTKFSMDFNDLKPKGIICMYIIISPNMVMCLALQVLLDSPYKRRLGK